VPPLRLILAESRATLRLAVPLMAGQLSQMLMGLIDSAMVGRVGVVPLAAAAFGNSLLSMPMLIGIGLLISVSVRVAQAHGAGQEAEAGEILRHGLALSVGAGVLLAAGVSLLSFGLQHFGQSPEVATEARTYLILMGWSLVPMLVSLALKQFSEALHHPWPPMIILLTSVGVNSALNWVLIYGNLGFPALGLAGAGLSTLIARCLGAVALWIYVRKARRFAEHTRLHWLRPLEGEKLRNLIRVGLPTAGMLVLESSAFSFAAIMVGWLGAVPLAAHQIALACSSTTFMLPLGLSMATTIRVGQAVGGGEKTRLRAICVSAQGLGMLVMLTCGALLALGRETIAGAFVHDPAVISQAMVLLLAAALFQVFDGLQVVASGALRGLADVNFPVLLCLVAYWGVALPLGYLAGFPGGYGALGVWFGLAAGLAFAGSLLSARTWWQTRG